MKRTIVDKKFMSVHEVDDSIVNQYLDDGYEIVHMTACTTIDRCGDEIGCCFLYMVKYIDTDEC